MTQQELADELDVARETVGNWENGVSTPRNKMALLQQVLGTNLTENVTAEAQSGGVLLKLSPEVQAEFDAMTPAEQEELLAVATGPLLERMRAIRRRLDG